VTNPRTIDRRDVSHSTNPVGAHGMIEADALPNVAELPEGTTQACSGRARKEVDPAESEEDNSVALRETRAAARDAGRVQS
jgi:hypothetical protein